MRFIQDRLKHRQTGTFIQSKVPLIGRKVSPLPQRPTPVVPDIPFPELWVDELRLVADPNDSFAETVRAIERACIPGVSWESLQRVLTAADVAYVYAFDVNAVLEAGTIGYRELSTDLLSVDAN